MALRWFPKKKDLRTCCACAYLLLLLLFFCSSSRAQTLWAWL
jgi:hypothetical protein